MAALQCEICGGKLMAKSGGLFECEYCGMQYDKTRIQEMVQEIKGTVKVEGTVQVAGTVKLDGAVQIEGNATVKSLLNRANSLLKDGKWDTAKEVIHQVLMIEPDCSQAHIYEYLANKHFCKEENLEYVMIQGDYEIRQWEQLLQRVTAEDKARLENRIAARFKRLTQEEPPSQQLLARRHQAELLDGSLKRCGGYWIACSVSGELFLWIENEEKASWTREVLTWPKGVIDLLTPSGMIIAVYADGTCRAAVRSDQRVKQLVESWEDVKLVKFRVGTIVTLSYDGNLRHYPLQDSRNSSQEQFFTASGWGNVEQMWLLSSKEYEYAIGLTTDGTLLSTAPMPEELPTSNISKFEVSFHEVRNWVKTDGSCFLNDTFYLGSRWPDIKNLCAYRVSGRIGVLTVGGTWVERNYNSGMIWQRELCDVAYYAREPYHMAALYSDGSISLDGKMVSDNSTYVALFCNTGWIAAVDTQGYIKMIYSEEPVPENAGIFSWKLFGSAETMEQEIQEAKVRNEAMRVKAEERRRVEKIRKEEERCLREEQRMEEHRQYANTLLAEKKVLVQELQSLHGLFTGKRRKEIEARLAKIETELKGLS